MKLSNSEVLLLTQVLYHIKCADSYFEFSDKIHDLHDKFCNHLLSNSKDVEDIEENHDEENNEEECVWHDDHLYVEEESFDEEELLEEISLKDLIGLDPVRVTYKGKKSSIFFEKGISKSSLDLNVDDGEEILCDVVRIERHAEMVAIEHVSGWSNFDVQKFPKSWTSLLEVKKLYKVV